MMENKQLMTVGAVLLVLVIGAVVFFAQKNQDNSLGEKTLAGQAVKASGKESQLLKYGDIVIIKTAHNTYFDCLNSGAFDTAYYGTQILTSIGSVPLKTAQLNDQKFEVWGGSKGVIVKWNDKIALKSLKTGSYLTALSEEEEFAGKNAAYAGFGIKCRNKGNIDEWEQFQVIGMEQKKDSKFVTYGDKISLETHHGKYVAAEKDSESVIGNRDKIGPWEKFSFTRVGVVPNPSVYIDPIIRYGDKVTFKTAHAGSYLQCMRSEAAGRSIFSIGVKAPTVGGTPTAFVIEGGSKGTPVHFQDQIALNFDVPNRITPADFVTALDENGGLHYDWAADEDVAYHAPFGLSCSADGIKDWEKFTPYPHIDNKVGALSEIKHGQKLFLKTAHNKFVAAEPNGAVLGDRVQFGPWETFTILKVS